MILDGLNGRFTLNFHCYEQPFKKSFLHTYRRVYLHTRPAEYQGRSQTSKRQSGQSRRPRRRGAWGAGMRGRGAPLPAGGGVRGGD